MRSAHVKKIITIIVTIIALSTTFIGCVGGSAVRVPADWSAHQNKNRNEVSITKHSQHLETVRVTRYTTPTRFANTALSINSHMEVFEAAEIAINNMRVSDGVFNLTVDDVAPVVIDDHLAFQIFGAFTMENGLPRRYLLFGVLHHEKYYTEILYHALADHYFAAALPDVVTFTENFTLTNSPRLGRFKYR